MPGLLTGSRLSVQAEPSDRAAGDEDFRQRSGVNVVAGRAGLGAMCNLYSITTNQEAIRALFPVINRYVGNLQPMPSAFPSALDFLDANRR
jgi:hypothetical protein